MGWPSLSLGHSSPYEGSTLCRNQIGFSHQTSSPFFWHLRVSCPSLSPLIDVKTFLPPLIWIPLRLFRSGWPKGDQVPLLGLSGLGCEGLAWGVSIWSPFRRQPPCSKATSSRSSYRSSLQLFLVLNMKVACDLAQVMGSQNHLPSNSTTWIFGYICMTFMMAIGGWSSRWHLK